MVAPVYKSMYLTWGEKAYALAFGLVIVMTTGITVFIMSGIEGANAIPAEPSPYASWTLFAGAFSGAVALYAARGWMGRPGVLGFGRACMGSLAVAFMAAAFAGTLIWPLYGTFYAPVVVVSAFIETPLLAAGWFLGMLGVHHLMTVIVDERRWGYGRTNEKPALEHLSHLSQAQLYRRSSDH